MSKDLKNKRGCKKNSTNFSKIELLKKLLDDKSKSGNKESK